MTVANGADTTSEVCKKVQADPSIVKYKTTTFIPQKCKTTVGSDCTEWENDAALTGIPLVGLSVVK